MEKPKISVIVPIYKAEDFLPESIKQLQNQTYPNLEIILVDDGSPDKSGEICDNFAQDDKRIVVVHKANGGASDARNAGIDKASGDYICFADSDDHISPNYVTTLYDDCSRTSYVDLVMQGFIQEGKNFKHSFSIDDAIYSKDDGNYDRFFSNVFINDYSGPYCKLFKRGLIEEHNIRYSTAIIYAEDFDFLLRYLLHCKCIVASSAQNYTYLMHEGSVSSKIYPFNKELSAINQLGTSFDELCAYIDSEALLKSREISLSNYVRRLITANYSNGYTRSERIKNLKSLDVRFLKIFAGKSYGESTFWALVSSLFILKCLGLLDILLYIRLIIIK